ncbi:MAG: tetratricopeptide repeat protein [Phycisphaerae bacterium]|nr:tetratricopeptide repeat protein [Phycisphaerae bacterium]
MFPSPELAASPELVITRAIRRAIWHVRLAILRLRALVFRRDERKAILLHAFRASQNGDFRGFARCIELVGGISQWDPQTLACAAVRYSDAGESESARRLLAQALEKRPDDPLVLLCYGNYLFKERQFQKAADCLKKALEGLPNDPWGLTTLGHTYFWLGRLEEARQCYLDSISHRDPHDLVVAEIYDALGQIAARLEQWEEAAQHWREAVTRSAKNGLFWYNLGDALLHAGDYRGAVKALRRSIRLGSERPAWDFYDLASCYRQLGDLRRARVYCDRSLSYAPYDEDALSLKAELESGGQGESA